MRTRLGVLIVLSLTSVLASCAVASGSGDGSSTTMNLVRPMYGPPQITTTESGFELVIEREMPTPGWTFDIDEVKVDQVQRRIEIRITENRPDGMVAQVITPGIVKVPLERVDPAVYFLELWMRRGKKGPHQPAQAFVAQAR